MRRPITLALLALAPLGVAACGNSDDDSDEAATTQATPAAESPATTRSETGDNSAKAAAALRLARVGSFDQPVYVTAPPKDKRRIFVVEQSGKVQVVKAGKRLKTPFLDVTSKIISGGEQGLLSIAFAPDYAKSRTVYANYTDKGGTQSVVAYKVSRKTPDRASPSSERLVLKYDGEEANHNGGLIKFGPDRLLYIGTGDGGGAGDEHGARGHAQDLGSLLGKILRINPKASGGKPYSVPSDNPFVGRGGARPEIYSYGLRNPWRFSFDRSTGALAIGDVGQGEIEEIDYAPKGQARGVNYGWRPFEGSRRFKDGEDAPGHVEPVIELSHSDGNCSITGGYVVRDPQLERLRGRYVYADFCAGKIRSAKLSAGRASGDGPTSLKKLANVSSFGEDGRGRVYVMSLDGPVYRLAD